MGADPCVIDIIPIIPAPEMQVDRRPVVQFGVVNADGTRPAGHIRQGAVCEPDLFVVRHGDFFRPVADAHPFRDEVSILFRVV